MKNHYPVKKCLFCDSLAISRGLCRKHYNVQRSSGLLQQHGKLTPKEIFESRIQKTESCWLWIGAKNGSGYGMFQPVGGKKLRAHRYSYELYIGTLSDGLVVMHSCDTPACVNPAHLSEGTYLQNRLDSVSKLRHQHGESHWSSKLTSAQVDDIRSSSENGPAIAKKYGIHQSTVSRIRAGKRRAIG